ncbi:MAG: UDP-glucose/GDP-mannose dehydrogenase family protein [Ignavibacteria bacterium]|nr:UDP-glucose/GDP-mannose dehydrogenase family protein [Ignavibacteria bacterium]
MSYSIGVIGTGYVGLVSGTCFAESGNSVLCVDIDAQKVEKLQNGILPIYEPDLDHLLERNIKKNRLHFTTDLAKAVHQCPILFLCLPTPPDEDGSADLQYVLNAAADIAKILERDGIKEPRILVNKSTVPVGTTEKVRSVVRGITSATVEVVSNPEFLREGFAVEDFMKPDRVVVGTSSKFAEETMRDLYEPFVRSGNPIYVMDEKSAEITKYAANSFLAMRISFMNDLSNYCEAVGADIENVRIGIGSDSRIGKRFLFSGIGYGGSCFPKDVKALIHSTDMAEKPLKIMKAVEDVNYEQIVRFTNRIIDRFGTVSGRHFALWGLAFKPNTDDTREAPAFKIIERLLEEGASISSYDPEAFENTKRIFEDRITYATSAIETLINADALIIATEWNEFRKPDFSEVKKTLKEPIIFDGRNLYELHTMENAGFEYHSIGRRTILPNR